MRTNVSGKIVSNRQGHSFGCAESPTLNLIPACSPATGHCSLKTGQ